MVVQRQSDRWAGSKPIFQACLGGLKPPPQIIPETHLIAFLTVATTARRYEVIPIVAPPLAFRVNVINLPSSRV